MQLVTKLFAHRRYIWRAAKADFRHQYAGTGLGFFWNILNPLLLIAVYSLVFARLVGLRSEDAVGSSYTLYLCAGLFPWLAFAESLIKASTELLRSAVYLRRMSSPPEVFVAKSVLTSTFGFAILCILLLGFTALGGRPITSEALYIPCIVVLMALLAYGIGLSLAVIRVFFRDIGEILRVLIRTWMWTMPIIYTESLYPESHRFLLDLNPPYPFVRALRQVFLGTGHVDSRDWLLMIGWSLAALTLGALISNRLSGEVRDVL